MLATPEPQQDAELAACRAEVRDTLRKVRERARAQPGSRAFRLTKLMKQALSAEDLEALDGDPEDTLPPDYAAAPAPEKD